MTIGVLLRRAFTLSLILTVLGCGKQDVYNDDYEAPPEPDYALRGLLGVRTLRGSFEMPEGMRSYRRGLIFIEEGKVTGTNGWFVGDGGHTFHADGKTEYAKTIHVEYMNWKNDGEWQGFFRDIPSIAWSNPKVNKDFWERFENEQWRTQGGDSPMRARFGNYHILALWFGSKENSATGSLETVLHTMDCIALLAAEFSPEKARVLKNEAWREPPPKEKLQSILDARLR